MHPAELPLHDVHLPVSPSWWPPAPGWWMVIGLLVVAVGLWIFRWYRRRRYFRMWRVVFERESNAVPTPEGVAQMSDLLRRAARRIDPNAVVLAGEDWLRFLDGENGTAFSQGEGRLFLEGAYLPNVDPEAYALARALACERFLELMAGRR